MGQSVLAHASLDWIEVLLHSRIQGNIGQSFVVKLLKFGRFRIQLLEVLLHHLLGVVVPLELVVRGVRCVARALVGALVSPGVGVTACLVLSRFFIEVETYFKFSCFAVRLIFR